MLRIGIGVRVPMPMVDVPVLIPLAQLLNSLLCPPYFATLQRFTTQLHTSLSFFSPHLRCFPFR